MWWKKIIPLLLSFILLIPIVYGKNNVGYINNPSSTFDYYFNNTNVPSSLNISYPSNVQVYIRGDNVNDIEIKVGSKVYTIENNQISFGDLKLPVKHLLIHKSIKILKGWRPVFEFGVPNSRIIIKPTKTVYVGKLIIGRIYIPNLGNISYGKIQEIIPKVNPYIEFTISNSTSGSFYVLWMTINQNGTIQINPQTPPLENIIVSNSTKGNFYVLYQFTNDKGILQITPETPTLKTITVSNSTSESFYILYQFTKTSGSLLINENTPTLQSVVVSNSTSGSFYILYQLLNNYGILQVIPETPTPEDISSNVNITQFQSDN